MFSWDHFLEKDPGSSAGVGAGLVGNLAVCGWSWCPIDRQSTRLVGNVNIVCWLQITCATDVSLLS